MIEVMGVLMGIDLQAFARPEGSSTEGDVPPFASSTSTQKQSASPSEPKPSSSKESQPEDVPMEEPEEETEEDEEAIEEKKREVEAEAQKKIGNDAYRKRDFATAATAFEKAWDIWPKDITFLTNLGGASYTDN